MNDKSVIKTHRTVEELFNGKLTEPTYNDLICLCKLNIEQLLRIGYKSTDAHIENHFGGEIGLLNVIDGYVQILKKLYALKPKQYIQKEDE